MTPKTQLSKEKNSKLGFIKVKNICPLEETIKKMKRQLIELEKVFPNHISDKGAVSRIYKELFKTKQ